MVPLAYLIIRIFVGLLQFTERYRRAFMSSSLVLVAAGALHCWAIVYALFTAVHSRAERSAGYYEDITEHLPSTVAWSEKLAVASLWVWLLAGFATAAVRVSDDDAADLPMGLEDCKTGPLMKILRSPMLRKGLSFAQSISCAGLFIDIVLLGISMALMQGSITACEVCLFSIAVVFALPHAVIALGQLSPVLNSMLAGILPLRAFEAAAVEAAALGPQLCVILAIADAPDQAYLWQNIVYLTSTVAFFVAVLACGLSPSKQSGSALPPEETETFVCLALDVAAALTILLGFADMNSSKVWVGMVIVCVVGAAGYTRLRDEAMEWLEPVFVIPSANQKLVPNAQRQRMRVISWTASILCAITALGDIVLHPPALPAAREPAEFYSNELMLRWLPSVAENRKSDMLATIADVLGLNVDALQLEETFSEHRLMLFKGKVQTDTTNQLLLMAWVAAAHHPSSKSKLAEFVDTSFPAALSLNTCFILKQGEAVSFEQNDKDKLGSLTSSQARAAYEAACDWWTPRVAQRMLQHDAPASPLERDVPELLSNELLLRWMPSVAEDQTSGMLATVADVLGVGVDTLQLEEMFPEHRLMMFRGKDQNQTNSKILVIAWAAAAHHPESKSKLAEIVDTSFPAVLTLSNCYKLKKGGAASFEQDDKLGSLTTDDAKAAYAAGCGWWARRVTGAANVGNLEIGGNSIGQDDKEKEEPVDQPDEP